MTMTRVTTRLTATAALAVALALGACTAGPAAAPATPPMAAADVARLAESGPRFRSTEYPVQYQLAADGTLRIDIEHGSRTIPGTWARRGHTLCIMPQGDGTTCYAIHPQADGRYRFRDTARGEMSEPFILEP